MHNKEKKRVTHEDWMFELDVWVIDSKVSFLTLKREDAVSTTRVSACDTKKTAGNGYALEFGAELAEGAEERFMVSATCPSFT